MASSRGGGGKRRAWRPPKTEPRDQSHATTKEDKFDYSGEIVEIDGSVKEGGGQILRISVALSCLLGKAIHITKVRANRSAPGLRPQHLAGLQLVSRICRGRLIGDHPGSTEISFFPGKITADRYTADPKTAGSISLLLQVSLPFLLFAKDRSELLLRGGTNVDMAPPIDYMLKVFRPVAEQMGVRFDYRLNQRGFYPKGRGEVVIIPEPVRFLKPITLLERGEIDQIIIESFTAGLVPHKVSHEMATSAQSFISRHLSHYKGPIHVDTKHYDEREAFGNGSGIISVAMTTSGCVLGSAGNGNKLESGERCGQRIAEELVHDINSGGCVDQYMQDQLMIYMALAKGTSKILTGPLTLHTQTAIHIIELMTPIKFKVTKLASEQTDVHSTQTDTHTIECDGIGMELS